MKIKLIQNVMIDGVVRMAGETIDTTQSTANAQSMIQYGWAVALEGSTPKSESADESDSTPEAESVSPETAEAPEAPAPKPRRRKAS